MHLCFCDKIELGKYVSFFFFFFEEKYSFAGNVIEFRIFHAPKAPLQSVICAQIANDIFYLKANTVDSSEPGTYGMVERNIAMCVTSDGEYGTIGNPPLVGYRSPYFFVRFLIPMNTKRSVRGIAYRVFEIRILPAMDNTQFCANHLPAEWVSYGRKEER